jgi:hypothetical protein
MFSKGTTWLDFTLGFPSIKESISNEPAEDKNLTFQNLLHKKAKKSTAGLARRGKNAPTSLFLYLVGAPGLWEHCSEAVGIRDTIRDIVRIPPQ